MLKIEWVEIPAGKFIKGLSPQQKDELHIHLKQACGIDQLGDEERALLEAICQKPYTEWTPAENAYNLEQFSKGSPIIWYTQALHDLNKIPDARVRSVSVFYIARFPISHSQSEIWYQSSLARQMGWNETRHKHWLVSAEALDRPTQFQIWEEADALAHWLGGRLPRMLEWEKAARGPDGNLYPWGNEWNPGAGNFGTPESRIGDPEKRKGRVTAVDAYPEGASPYGVMDMAGNLSEWTAIYDDNLGVPIRMGYNIKESPGIAQFFFASPVHRLHGDDEHERYVGCRPILTEWGHHLWPGFRPEFD